MQPGKLPPAVNLLTLITGHWRAQAVHVAARLGIADVLRDGPKTVAAIATLTSAEPEALYRLLRALASLGVFVELEDGRFDLTPTAELLQSDRPGTMRSLTLSICGAPYAAWNAALYSVKTGKTAFEHVHGMPFFAYLASDPEASATFDECMSDQSRMAHSAVVASYDFSRFSRIVDVGGGNGTLLELLLRKYPHMTGVLFDQPHVAAGARERLARSDVAARCEIVEGSFFEAVPGGADAYIMAMVIHDWDDERASAILRNCHRAMGPGGRLLLSELVIPPGNLPFFGKLLDLDMLVNLGGKERTDEEYTELLAKSGFDLIDIVPAYGPSSALSIVEGAPR